MARRLALDRIAALQSPPSKNAGGMKFAGRLDRDVRGLDMDDGTMRGVVNCLRKRYRGFLREEFTLNDAAQVQEGLRSLPTGCRIEVLQP